MNAMIQTLLAGAALGALATTTAVAGNAPVFHVTALHAGSAVNKTRVRDPRRIHQTYTLGVSTYDPASDFGLPEKLTRTFYTWECCDNSCAVAPWQARQKIKVPQKSTYGEIGTAKESYGTCSFGGPLVYYGDTYTLTDPDGEGKTDFFVSTLIGKFVKGGRRYKGTLNLDVSVAIGQ